MVLLGTAHAKSSCSPSVGASLVLEEELEDGRAMAIGAFADIKIGAAGAPPSAKACTCDAAAATGAGTGAGASAGTVRRPV